MLNKTKKYKKLLLKSEIIANILNVVGADEKSLPDQPAKLTAKARRLIYKNFFLHVLKIATAERRFARMKQNLVREEISTFVRLNANAQEARETTKEIGGKQLF